MRTFQHREGTRLRQNQIHFFQQNWFTASCLLGYSKKFYSSTFVAYFLTKESVRKHITEVLKWKPSEQAIATINHNNPLKNSNMHMAMHHTNYALAAWYLIEISIFVSIVPQSTNTNLNRFQTGSILAKTCRWNFKL